MLSISVEYNSNELKKYITSEDGAKKLKNLRNSGMNHSQALIFLIGDHLKITTMEDMIKVYEHYLGFSE